MRGLLLILILFTTGLYGCGRKMRSHSSGEVEEPPSAPRTQNLLPLNQRPPLTVALKPSETTGGHTKDGVPFVFPKSLNEVEKHPELLQNMEPMRPETPLQNICLKGIPCANIQAARSYLARSILDVRISRYQRVDNRLVPSRFGKDQVTVKITVELEYSAIWNLLNKNKGQDIDPDEVMSRLQLRSQSLTFNLQTPKSSTGNAPPNRLLFEEQTQGQFTLKGSIQSEPQYEIGYFELGYKIPQLDLKVTAGLPYNRFKSGVTLEIGKNPTNLAPTQNNNKFAKFESVKTSYVELISTAQNLKGPSFVAVDVLDPQPDTDDAPTLLMFRGQNLGTSHSSPVVHIEEPASSQDNDSETFTDHWKAQLYGQDPENNRLTFKVTVSEDSPESQAQNDNSTGATYLLRLNSLRKPKQEEKDETVPEPFGLSENAFISTTSDDEMVRKMTQDFNGNWSLPEVQMVLTALKNDTNLSAGQSPVFEQFVKSNFKIRLKKFVKDIRSIKDKLAKVPQAYGIPPQILYKAVLESGALGDGTLGARSQNQSSSATGYLQLLYTTAIDQNMKVNCDSIDDRSIKSKCQKLISQHPGLDANGIESDERRFVFPMTCGASNFYADLRKSLGITEETGDASLIIPSYYLGAGGFKKSARSFCQEQPHRKTCEVLRDSAQFHSLSFRNIVRERMIDSYVIGYTAIFFGVYFYASSPEFNEEMSIQPTSTISSKMKKALFPEERIFDTQCHTLAMQLFPDIYNNGTSL